MFIVDAQQMSARLPNMEIAGTRVLARAFLDVFGSELITVDMARQFRGACEHFKTTNIIAVGFIRPEGCLSAMAMS